MQDWQKKNIEDAIRRANRFEIDFDRFPPRTLIHGYFNKNDSSVHIYTDNSGRLNALYYKIGKDEVNLHSEESPNFNLNDHLPEVAYIELSDYQFLMNVIDKMGVIKADSTPFNNLVEINKKNNTTYFKHPKISTITGATKGNVFSSPLHLEQGSILKNNKLELRHGSLVDPRSITEFNHGISQTILHHLEDEDHDIMRDTLHLILGSFNHINDQDLQHMAHILKEYIDLARIATSIHPKAWDDEKPKSVKP